MKRAVFAILFCGVIRAENVQLGTPTYLGTGCTPGSVATSLSPDASELSILFSEYVVDVSGPNSIASKQCSFSIPIHIPKGLSVSIAKIDYRGYNGLPKGAEAVFSVDYFFLGFSGRPYSKTFKGELDREYVVTDKLKIADAWSNCGGDFNIRVNTGMKVSIGKNGGQALSTLDSIDTSTGVKYQLKWKKCKK